MKITVIVEIRLYIIIVVIYYYLEKQNDKVLKFGTNNTTYFEKPAFLF